MSRRRPPVPIREAIAVLGERGCAVDIDLAGTHAKIFWNSGGRRHMLVVAKTPSDHRATKNARAFLRRVLRGGERS
jgi:hypothetical protein